MPPSGSGFGPRSMPARSAASSAGPCAARSLRRQITPEDARRVSEHALRVLLVESRAAARAAPQQAVRPASTRRSTHVVPHRDPRRPARQRIGNVLDVCEQVVAARVVQHEQAVAQTVAAWQHVQRPAEAARRPHRGALARDVDRHRRAASDSRARRAAAAGHTRPRSSGSAEPVRSRPSSCRAAFTRTRVVNVGRPRSSTHARLHCTRSRCVRASRMRTRSLHVALPYAYRFRYSRRPSRNAFSPTISSSWRMTTGAFW